MKHTAQYTAVPPRVRNCHCRETALVLIPLLALAGLLSIQPIAQDPGYHDFAGGHSFAGMPNFANVVSNLPFLVIGIAGLLRLGHIYRPGGAWPTWAVFFAGVALTGIGSSHYHWAPADSTLVWDRLPMTLAFMGMFTALLSEHAGERLARYLLPPAILTGLASIGWWLYADDLRLYVWVQAAPLLVVLLALLLFPPRYTHRAYLLCAFGLYVLAKIAEFHDRELYVLTADTLSGHSLKHVLAAASVLYVYLMLRRRVPVPPHDPSGSTMPAGSKPALSRPA